MKHVGIAIILLASLCCAQGAGGFQPSSTNVWGEEYPRVDNAGRVQIRVKAPAVAGYIQLKQISDAPKRLPATFARSL